MYSSWLQFSKDINQLSSYIKYLNSVDVILKSKLKNEGPSSEIHLEQLTSLVNDVQNVRSKKVLEYNLCIVTLYGILERFIEDVGVQYLDLITGKLQSYSSLPKKIRNHHLGLTTTVIQKINYPKYSSLRVEELVSRLHGNLINNNSKINSIVFSDHSANFRHSVVCDFIGRLNIENLSYKLKNTEVFKEFIKESYGEGINHGAIRDNVIFSILNDLADRRNDVSHGVDNGNPILSFSAIQEYIDFVLLYGKSLYQVLESESYNYFIEKEYTILPPIAVYDNKILCIELPYGKIQRNDEIIVKLSNGFMTKRQILEIQVDSVPRTSVEVANKKLPVKIGMKLNGRVAMNQVFFFKIKK